MLTWRRWLEHERYSDHGHTKALSTGRLSDEKSIKHFHETLETSGAVRARKREVSVSTDVPRSQSRIPQHTIIGEPYCVVELVRVI